jgi:hypothetical protein
MTTKGETATRPPRLLELVLPAARCSGPRLFRGDRGVSNPRPPGPQPGALPTELRPPCAARRCGAPGGIRTPDQELRRLLLCPLSYGGPDRHRPVERVKGIEPSPPAWKAGALPLSYTRTAPKGSVGGPSGEPGCLPVAARASLPPHGSSGWPDLNRRPPAPKAGALPNCATARRRHCRRPSPASVGFGPGVSDATGGYAPGRVASSIWQSNGLLIRRFWVRVPGDPPSRFLVVHRSSFIVRRSSFVVHRSSFIVLRSSFFVRRSSFVILRSSFFVRRSSFVVRRSSFVASAQGPSSTIPSQPAAPSVASFPSRV